MLPWMMTAAPKYVMKLKILLKMLSKEAFEFSKEAEQLIQYAADMTNFCKQPEKAHAAVLSSILEAAHVAHSSNTEKKTPLEAIPVLSEVLSPAQNIAVASAILEPEEIKVCTIDFTSATLEAEKRMEQLHIVKNEAIQTKQLAERAMCTEGILTVEGKESQKALLSHLHRSEKFFKDTNRLIDDSIRSIDSAKGSSSFRAKVRNLLTQLSMQHMGVFCSGVIFGVCCGFVICYAVKAKKNQILQESKEELEIQQKLMEKADKSN